MSNVFGMAEQALQLCEDRATMLTNNLVNSSTPNYKAKDIDFYTILQNANSQDYHLAKTDAHHIATSGTGSNEQVMYRVPMQTSLDGNTVDPEIERKNFIENALRYQVNLTFIQNKSDEYSKAMKV